MHQIRPRSSARPIQQSARRSHAPVPKWAGGLQRTGACPSPAQQPRMPRPTGRAAFPTLALSADLGPS
eukprot:1786831-Alexandrium_andersonii.AAC.1